MKFLGIFVLMLPLLGGCVTDGPTFAPVTQVTVRGPRFAASDFDCGKRPLPPDPKTVGKRGGSAAGRHENRLGTWGQGCANQLGAVGRTLRSAGQVVDR